MTTYCRSSTLLLSILGTYALTLGSCSDDSPGKAAATLVSPEEAANLLINRNWMDLWPRSETETLRVFRFVPSMGGGVFQDRTLFHGSFELFSFSADESTIHFELHHKKQKQDSSYRIERVDGPAPFDLRLTIDPSPRGPNVYFGRSSESAMDLEFHPLR